METSCTFPADPRSVRDARTLIRAVCTGAGLDDVEYCVSLLVSELVTNAVVHAGTPLHVEVRLEGEALTVAVSDGDPRLPAPSGTRGEDGGFGLWLLDREAERWGVRLHQLGKTVWFSVPCQPHIRQTRATVGNSLHATMGRPNQQKRGGDGRTSYSRARMRHRRTRR